MDLLFHSQAARTRWLDEEPEHFSLVRICKQRAQNATATANLAPTSKTK